MMLRGCGILREVNDEVHGHDEIRNWNANVNELKIMKMNRAAASSFWTRDGMIMMRLSILFDWRDDHADA